MMPSFNGLHALKETKKFNPELPFILCTGSVNEEIAVECIKAGAQDYVLKEHMTRLPFAVKEALDQVMINKEKKASELLLKENEEKLQSIISAVRVGIGLVIDRIIVEVNDFLCVMTGYVRSELIGKSSEILYSSHEEFMKVGNKIYMQMAEKNTGYVETNCKRKDGKILSVICSTAALDKNDYLKGVIFTIHDITERKQTEEALRESQHLFENLAKSSPVGIFRTRADGYTTYVNPKWRELSGMTSEEAIGYGWLKAVHPDDRKQLEKKWKSDVQTTNNSIAEYRFLKADGSIVWVMGNAVPEITGDEVASYIGTITDITERKLAEETLKENEEKYRRIFENVQDLYFETLIDGTILEISPSIKVMSKGLYTREELIGKPILDFYKNKKERAALFSKIMKVGSVSDFEITLKNKDGSLIPCSLSSKILFDEKGSPVKAIGSLRDITDRKNASDTLKLAKEKAEVSDKMKTSFLNNISHEVRTPLNGILGFAELISQNNLSEEDKKESYSMLYESSERLLNTITNYMDISLLTSGNMTVHKKDFIPAQILKRIFDDYKLICSDKKLELFLEIPALAEDFSVNTDPEIFLKIINHLLSNAIKFTEKGSIRFGCHVHEDEFEFFVQDTGIGIEKESVNKIFDRFEKVDQGPSRLTEGSGLGLSISKEMTDLLEGTLRVESEPDVGSCFTFTIPVMKNTGKNLSRLTGDKDIKQVGSRSILIAEDDETNFFFLKAILSRETSATVIHAINGMKAVELFKANQDIILVLMDMKMPEIDGFEATRQIKSINMEVPVIAITAYAMSGDEEKVRAAGCDGYLSKPLRKKSLLDKINEFVKI
jgi:PAS domain S-box-containing protein